MKDTILEGLKAHRDSGRVVGDFLTAVLENNLVNAVCHADDDNIKDIVEIARWVYQEMPSAAWGNSAKVQAWRDSDGMQGFMKRNLYWNTESNRLEVKKS